ncbi:hypothetical protein JST97_36035 [bacterium]|nr:hypothetical protein [bacterium]
MNRLTWVGFIGLNLLVGCAKPKPSLTPTPTAATYVSDGKVPEGAQLKAAEDGVESYLKNGSPSVDGQFYPFYRQLLKGQNHFYTASENEMNEKKQAGYTTEGQIGYILSKPGQGTVPLYHLFGRNDHFYTTSHQEAVDAVNKYQYAFVNISGFLYSEQAQGTVPLFRHFNGSSHFYTTSPQESQSIPSSGWNLEGVAGYLPEKK